jgi:acyl-CoA dehydrogenase
MIALETPKKFEALVGQARYVASEVFRPISRKYDLAEHEYPKELDMLASLIDGMNEGNGGDGAGAALVRRKLRGEGDGANRNGSNLLTVLTIIELCWGDVGLLLSMPRQGLGNSAIASVASEEQLARYGGRWAAMAITEPEAGSDSAAIRTTAVLDGEEYVLNGEKIYVTSGERAELVVVWATLDRSRGRAAIRSFVVERSNPGLKLERLDHKLGIRASDTATFRLEDCRVPRQALLGSAEKSEQDVKQGFGGAMQTFDNTRPLVAAMAVGVARASLQETRRQLGEVGVEIDYAQPSLSQSAAAARFRELEADYEAARLLTMNAAWMADNGKPNSLQASIAKAKAGRTCVEVALGCVELCGSVGYGESELLEKWARDAKILDIFEGTQQIQLLIVARQLLGKNSAELK